MADRKITDLTALTTPASADVLPIVDVSEAAAADKNKKITVGELFKGVPDGTAAAPAIAFESDDGNGIFLSTTDTVGIATNGSSRMTVSTTAVTSTLPVIVPDGTAAAPSVAFTGSGTDTGFYSAAANTLAASTGGTNALYIDSSQRVGVGTTSVSYKLDVNGSAQIRAGESLHFQNVAGSGIASIQCVGAGTNTDLSFNTATTERMRIDSSGNVGVGTSSPDGLLHVQDTANDLQIRVGGTTAGRDPLIRLQGRNTADDTNVYADIKLDSDNQLLLLNDPGTTGGTIGQNPVAITSAGSVGIGTTSPGTYKLNIDGPYDSDGLRVFAGASGYGTPLVVGRASGGEALRVDNGGRLLVGTSTPRSNVFRSGTTGITPFMQIETSTNSYSNGLSIINNSASGFGAMLSIGTSNANGIGSNALNPSGGQIGTIQFISNDGTNFIDAATIKAEVDGTSGTNDMPSRLVFSTTADGASSPSERMVINSIGQITWANSDAVLESINSNVDARIRGRAAGCNIYVQSNAQTGVYQTGTGWASASSRRIKNIVGDVDTEQCWDFVRNISLKRYYYKNQAQEGVTYLGPIAEEISELDPEMLIMLNEEDSEGKIPSYNQPLMQMKALSALQTALVRIETLEAEVAALKGA